MPIRIINKYLFKEAVISFLAVLLVLVLILVGGVFVKLLGRVADGSVDAGFLIPFLAWGSLKSISTLVVVSMFLGILLALGRMYKDSEIYALRTSGMSDRQLLRPLVWLGLIVALILLAMSFWIEPMAEKRIKNLRADAGDNINLAGITPGKFITFPGSSRVVFAEKSGEHKDQLAKIYLFEELAETIRVIAAETATQKTVSEYDGDYLELDQGNIFQGKPDGSDFTRGGFQQMGFRLPSIIQGEQVKEIDMMSVTELWYGGAAAHLAELHWRISFPVSVFVLVLLAVALSYSGPRQGRFGSLAVAILVYIFYANLLGLGKDMLEKETLPGWLGLWWVHLAFLLVAVFILLKQDGYFERLFGSDVPATGVAK